MGNRRRGGGFLTPLYVFAIIWLFSSIAFPLYELWEINETDPRMDPRFVIWDDFGLPVPRDEYCGGSVKG